MTDVAVGIFGWREVAKTIGKGLARCCICFKSQIIVCEVSHEDGIVVHLHRPFITLRDGENRNYTHGRYKSICGGVVKTSGDLKVMSLTGGVRILVPALRYRAKTSATDLGIREALGEHCLGAIVEEKQPGGRRPSP